MSKFKTSRTLAERTVCEAIEQHQELNPKLFEGDKLRPEVLGQIKEIVDLFLEELAEDEIKIKVVDVILVGSNVNYNYSKHSDLDVHILADTKELDCDAHVYASLYSAYRSLFNKRFEIDFYNIPVELYVETDGMPRVSNGVYSVVKNDWIQKPEPADIPTIDYELLNRVLIRWENKCKKLLNMDVAKVDPDKIAELIDEIYVLRKEGLNSEDGEFSTKNLIFKELRNIGYLEDLKSLKNQAVSYQLSLH